VSEIQTFLADLKEKRAKAQAKLEKARANVVTALKDFEELDTAINVLTKHGYIQGDVEQAPMDKPVEVNETYALLLRFLPRGEHMAMAPKQITELMISKGYELDPDYVRTALWRMAQRDILINRDGRYWWPRPKEEAPDAETSEASESTGLAGHGGSDCQPASESSSLSRSTPSQTVQVADWDDDVPF
jgi:hypothetical protein